MYVLRKKITNHLYISKICCIFAVSSRWRRWQAFVERIAVTYILLMIPIDSQESSKFHESQDWHLLVHMLCTTFVVFVIRALLEPLR